GGTVPVTVGYLGMPKAAQVVIVGIPFLHIVIVTGPVFGGMFLIFTPVCMHLKPTTFGCVHVYCFIWTFLPLPAAVFIVLNGSPQAGVALLQCTRASVPHELPGSNGHKFFVPLTVLMPGIPDSLPATNSEVPEKVIAP